MALYHNVLTASTSLSSLKRQDISSIQMRMPADMGSDLDFGDYHGYFNKVRPFAARADWRIVGTGTSLASCMASLAVRYYIYPKPQYSQMRLTRISLKIQN